MIFAETTCAVRYFAPETAALFRIGTVVSERWARRGTKATRPRRPSRVVRPAGGGGSTPMGRTGHPQADTIAVSGARYRVAATVV
jgi:hypothetical protein